MIDSLVKLYPNALLNPDEPTSFTDYYLFLYNGDSLLIPIADLDERQRQLLDVFNHSMQKADTVTLRATLETVWFDYLFQKSAEIPRTSDRVRFLHLDFYTLPSPFDYVLWQDTLQQALEGFIVALAINERRIVIVLDADGLDNDSLASISGLLTTLDDDFDMMSRGLLGQIQPVNSLLPTLFDYEYTLFSQSIELESFANVQYVSNVVLHFMGKQTLQQQPLLMNLRQVIVANSEYMNTIKALFEQQGNLTQAAEKLFVHRNTLTYRMNKFTRETGFNLQYLPDLILCYLIIH